MKDSLRKASARFSRTLALKASGSGPVAHEDMPSADVPRALASGTNASAMRAGTGRLAGWTGRGPVEAELPSSLRPVKGVSEECVRAVLIVGPAQPVPSSEARTRREVFMHISARW